MSRLNDHNVVVAREIIARYPKKKSALIPLVHLSQEQNGYVTEDGMVHIAELLDVTPAQVYGTGTFYEMFKFEPVGRYLVNICGTMSCALMGAQELIDRAEATLGITVGGTTDDGMITLEQAECQAACTEAPCLQVNYRFRYRVTPDELDQLLADLRSGAMADESPDHGTVAQVRQQIPADRWVRPAAPEAVEGAPVWMPAPEEATS